METVEPRDDEPFNTGELAVHDRLGIRQRMREIGQRVIRPFMPAQHQQFFAQLPMVLVGSVDATGRPWASVLVGRPGFMQAPDAGQLDFESCQSPATRWPKGCNPARPWACWALNCSAAPQPHERPCAGQRCAGFPGARRGDRGQLPAVHPGARCALDARRHRPQAAGR